MLDTDMSDGKAEGDLLELIRLEDFLNFTVTITHDGDGWRISCGDYDVPSLVTGQGASVPKAWFGQRPVGI